MGSSWQELADHVLRTGALQYVTKEVFVPTEAGDSYPAWEVAIPLMDRQLVRGVLYLAASLGSLLDTDHFDFLRDVAEHLSLAIARNELLERLQSRARDLELLLNVTSLLSVMLDLDDILQAAATRLVRALHRCCLRILGSASVEPGLR